MPFTKFIPKLSDVVPFPVDDRKILVAFEAPDHETIDRLYKIFYPRNIMNRHDGHSDMSDDGPKAGVHGGVLFRTEDGAIGFAVKPFWTICKKDEKPSLPASTGAICTNALSSFLYRSTSSLQLHDTGNFSANSSGSAQQDKYVCWLEVPEALRVNPKDSHLSEQERIKLLGTAKYDTIINPEKLADIEVHRDFINQQARHSALRLMLLDGILPEGVAKQAGYIPQVSHVAVNSPGTIGPRKS